MSLPAAGDKTQPCDATAHQVQPVVVPLDSTRLADDDAVGIQRNAIGNVVGAVSGAVFFVGREEQAETTTGRGVAGHARGRYHHRRDGAFHIRGAKPVQSLSLNVSPEGIHTPGGVGDGLGVKVAREYEMPPSGSEIQGDEQVGPRLVAGDDPGSGELQLREQVSHECRSGTLVARRIGTWRAYQLSGDVEDVQTLRTRCSHHLYREAQSTPCQVCRLTGSSRNSHRGLSRVGSRYFGPFSPKYLVLMRSAMGTHWPPTFGSSTMWAVHCATTLRNPSGSSTLIAHRESPFR